MDNKSLNMVQREWTCNRIATEKPNDEFITLQVEEVGEDRAAGLRGWGEAETKAGFGG